MFVQIPGGELIYAVAGLVIFAVLTRFDFQRLRRTDDIRTAPLLAASILDDLNVFFPFLSIFGGDEGAARLANQRADLCSTSNVTLIVLARPNGAFAGDNGAYAIGRRYGARIEAARFFSGERARKNGSNGPSVSSPNAAAE